MADPNSPVTRFQVWRAALPPALRLLITVNVATYLLFVLLSIFGVGWYLNWIALPFDAGQLVEQPWSVLTHSVANLYGGGFWGLISFGFGMMWLTWMGRDLEETYGSHQLFGLYALAAIGGAIVAVGVGLLSDREFGQLAGYSFGVWGPVGAIIVATAVLHPNRGVGLWLIGVISMKWIAIAFVVLDLAFYQDPAHIGAYLTGLGFGAAQKRGVELGAWARPLFGRSRGPSRRSAPPPSYSSASGGWSRRDPDVATRTAAPSRRTPTASRAKKGPPTQADIDSILDKINDKGMSSLTKEEKKVLEKWSGGA